MMIFDNVERRMSVFGALFLCIAQGCHTKRIEGLFGVHAFGQDDIEYGVHTFTFFNRDFDNLGDFAFDTTEVIIIKENSVFENRHVLFGPV